MNNQSVRPVRGLNSVLFPSFCERGDGMRSMREMVDYLLHIWLFRNHTRALFSLEICSGLSEFTSWDHLLKSEDFMCPIENLVRWNRVIPLVRLFHPILGAISESRFLWKSPNNNFVRLIRRSNWHDWTLKRHYMRTAKNRVILWAIKHRVVRINVPKKYIVEYIYPDGNSLISTRLRCIVLSE